MFKKLFPIYYIKLVLWKTMCWVCKKNQHTIGFLTFKLPTSSKNITNPLNITFDDLDIRTNYDY